MCDGVVVKKSQEIGDWISYNSESYTILKCGGTSVLWVVLLLHLGCPTLPGEKLSVTLWSSMGTQGCLAPFFLQDLVRLLNLHLIISSTFQCAICF